MLFQHQCTQITFHTWVFKPTCVLAAPCHSLIAHHLIIHIVSAHHFQPLTFWDLVQSYRQRYIPQMHVRKRGSITQSHHLFYSYYLNTKNEHDTSLCVFKEKLAQSHKGLGWQRDEEIKCLGEEWGVWICKTVICSFQEEKWLIK